MQNNEPETKKANGRELKFRAWDKKANQIINEVAVTREGYCALSPEKERFILMQYTGLNDKNGKDIYEGDVVIGQYKHYDPCKDDHIKDEKMGGVVFWDLYQWSFEVIEKFCDQDREGKCNYFDYCDKRDYWAPQVFDDMEIIGNICENPELLK